MAFTAEGKDGILEQLGRMTTQDGLPDRYCIKAANFATDALKQGRKSKEIELAIREYRMRLKKIFAEAEQP